MTTQNDDISSDQTEDTAGIWKILLNQGLSSHQLALAIALGLTIGILPTAWGTSLLCVLLSWRLGLNQLAVQTVNYLVYPLQLALFMPFALCGQQIFPSWFVSSAPFTWQAFPADWTQIGSRLLPVQCSALLGWVVLMPVFMLASYSLSFCLLKARERHNLATEVGRIHLQN